MVFDELLVTALAFLVFIVVAYRMGGRAVARALDGRAARIEHELSEAIRLREEAQASVSEYEQKYREIEIESQAIIAHANHTVETMRRDAEETLRQAVEARIAAANEKISRAEEMAVQDVQRHVVDVALAAARQVITDKMQHDADDTLIALALKDINRIVH